MPYQINTILNLKLSLNFVRGIGERLRLRKMISEPTYHPYIPVLYHGYRFHQRLTWKHMQSARSAMHYGDMTWLSPHLKSSALQKFVQQLVQVNSKIKSQLNITDSLCVESTISMSLLHHEHYCPLIWFNHKSANESINITKISLLDYSVSIIKVSHFHHAHPCSRLHLLTPNMHSTSQSFRHAYMCVSKCCGVSHIPLGIHEVSLIFSI